MATVEGKGEGIDEASRELRDIERRLQDMTPAWKAAAEALRAAVEERFQTETAFDGSDWAELKPETIAQRKPGKILQQSRHLANSVWAIGVYDGIEFGAGALYAARQQFGALQEDTSSTRDALDHPGRPFLPVNIDNEFIIIEGTPSGELADEIDRILYEYVSGARSRGGSR